MPDLLNLTACAKAVGVGRRSLYRYVTEQNCPAKKDGKGRLRANPDAVRRWMADHGILPGAGRGDTSMRIATGTQDQPSPPPAPDISSALADTQAELDAAAGASRTRPSGDEVTEALAMTGLGDVIREGSRPLTPEEVARIKAWYALARAKKEHQIAERERLRTERESARLVDAEETEAAWIQMITEARTRLLAVPAQVSSDVCRDGIEVWEVEELIERAIRRALEEIGGVGEGDGDG